MNKQIAWIPREAMEALIRHSWPGNVRELQNFIERSVILTSGNVLRPPLDSLKPAAETESLRAITLEDAEREHICKTLEQTRWVIAGHKGAAERLGIKRSTLGVRIFFLPSPSPEPDAAPLILTHGWPGSVLEFLKVIPALADPARHGGESQDAFHVVCPALPGYSFSDKPKQNGWSVEKIARAWSELMLRLAYQRYYAQGGDCDPSLTTAIALQDAAHCHGVHLHALLVQPDPATMNSLTDEEKEDLGAMKHYQDWDSGYSKQQSTRPQTLGYGLADSPAGQAAWILEKFWAWTDCQGNPENALTRDEMLDDIMLYWLPNAAASSARLYWESFNKRNSEPARIPLGCRPFS